MNRQSFDPNAFKGKVNKLGPMIPSKYGDMLPQDVVFPIVVYGQFKDYRNFLAFQI